jgi:hypothetical protein
LDTNTARPKVNQRNRIEDCCGDRRALHSLRWVYFEGYASFCFGSTGLGMVMRSSSHGECGNDFIAPRKDGRLCGQVEHNPKSGTSFKAPSMSRTNFNVVVSVGDNRELLLLRDAVLRSAGFDVFTTDNESQALARVSRGDCGVLLVCYSTPLPVKRHLAVAYRKECPEGRIIAVANQPVEKLEVADTLVYGIEGPEVLIDAIRGKLAKIES